MMDQYMGVPLAREEKAFVEKMFELGAVGLKVQESIRSDTFADEAVVIQDGHVVALSVGARGLKSIPESIGVLRHLRQLLLPYNDLRSFPASIANCTELEELNLSGTEFDAFPDYLRGLKKVKTLGMPNTAHIMDWARAFPALAILRIRTKQDLPPDFAALPLEELEFDWTSSQPLPHVLFQMPKLKRLTIEADDIKDLPAEVGNLSSLEVLVVKRFETIPASIRWLPCLTTLKLASSRLKVVPDAIVDCPLLRHVTISSEIIPDRLWNIPLESLDLDVGEGKPIPPQIFQMATLKKLTLRGKNRESLPNLFGGLGALESLNLQMTVDTLPPSIGKLGRLRSLEVDPFVVLPAEIASCQALEQITTTYGYVESLPPAIGSLARLKVLSLPNNRLRALPDTLGNLTSLKVLCVRSNQLERLPTSIGNLVHLETLDASSNPLLALPDSIGNLAHLRHLVADEAKLTGLPAPMGGCRSLEKLSVCKNQLKQIPETIGACHSLVVLKVDENRLQELPASIGQCTNLSTLSARSNQLRAIPDTLRHCPAIVTLDLSKNPLESLPEDLGSALTHLRTIGVEETNLTAIPKSFSTLLDLGILAKGTDFAVLPRVILDRIRPQLPHDLPEVEILCLAKLQFQSTKPLASHYEESKAGFEAENGHVVKLSLYGLILRRMPAEITQMSQLRDLIYNTVFAEFTDLPPLIQQAHLKDYRDLPIPPAEQRALADLAFSIGKSLKYVVKLPEDKDREHKNQFVVQNGHITELLITAGFEAGIPPSLGSLSQLKRLVLLNNVRSGYPAISVLPPALGSLAALEEVEMKESGLRVLPDFISKWIALRTLALGNNRFTSVPAVILRLPTLENLDLSDCNIASLPEEFGSALPRLKVLKLGYNEITQLPASLADLTALEEVDLGNNMVETIPPNVARLFLNQFAGAGVPEAEQLALAEILAISKYELKLQPGIWRGIYGLSFGYSVGQGHVTGLYFSVKGPAPACLSQFQHLEELRLSQDKGITLPATLASLPIKKFEWKNRNTREIPPVLLEMQALEELYMEECPLRSLPPELFQLQRLKVLSFSKTEFPTVPATLANLVSLEVFEISSGRLKEFPEGLRGTKKLEKLDLHENRLVTIPEWLGDLKCLKELYLNDNRLVHLPETCGHLAKLEIFQINRNRLENLPTSLEHLKALKKFSVSDNQIAAVPTFIWLLPNLNEFKYSNNPFASKIKLSGQDRRRGEEILEIKDAIKASLGAEYFAQKIARNLPIDEYDANFPTIYKFAAKLAEICRQTPNESSKAFQELIAQKGVVDPSEVEALEAIEAVAKSELSHVLKVEPERGMQFSQRGGHVNVLCIQEAYLASLPDAIGRFTALEELYLASNNLTELPASFTQLRALRKLDLSRNQLTQLPDAIGNLTKLEELYLQHNQLAGLPASFTQLRALRQLDLQENSLAALPEAIGDLVALEKLNVGKNSLKTLPASLRLLARLAEIDFDGNPLGAIAAVLPDRIVEKYAKGFDDTLPLEERKALALLKISLGEQLEKKQRLDLTHTSYTVAAGHVTQFGLSSRSTVQVPPFIAQLPQLTRLVIQGERITELPGNLGDLVNLETLDISCTLLQSLPAGIGALAKLKLLSLQNNALTSLPDTIGQLASLRVLRCTSNALETVPETLGNLTSLEDLELNNNRIEALPGTLGKLASLKRANFNNNRLRTLPEEVGQWIHLTVLSVKWNRLAILPDVFQTLARLQVLDIEGNSLVSLPDSVGTLPALRILDIRHNQLAALPTDLSRLQQLERLYLSHNFLAELPKSLATLPLLKIAYVNDNPPLGPMQRMDAPAMQAFLTNRKHVGSA